MVGAETYHGLRIRVRGRIRIPLRHHLAGRACIWAISTGFAALIRTHRPSSILILGRHSNQACVGRKLTFTRPRLQRDYTPVEQRSFLDLGCMCIPVMLVSMFERVEVRVAMLCACKRQMERKHRAHRASEVDEFHVRLADLLTA